MQARSALESTAPKARSRSRENVTLNEAPRISPRVSSKLLSLSVRLKGKMRKTPGGVRVG